ncbi:transporter associated domain-containing protein, partial [Pectobacterium carotovorum]
WLVKGGTDLHALQQVVDSSDLVDPKEEYASLAGMLLANSDEFLKVGDTIELHRLRFHILEVSEYRIELVRVERIVDEEDAEEA